jgi:hypothetical protein
MPVLPPNGLTSLYAVSEALPQNGDRGGYVTTISDAFRSVHAVEPPYPPEPILPIEYPAGKQRFARVACPQRYSPIGLRALLGNSLFFSAWIGYRPAVIRGIVCNQWEFDMVGRLLALALAFLAMAPATTAIAQVEVTLAEEKVRKAIREVDRIDVRSVPGKFSGIRVYALDGTAVDITKIDVKYSDGSVFTEDRGRPIRLDQRDVRTRLLGPRDGNGPEKFIDEVVMYYKTARGEPIQARVRIVGVTSRSGAKAYRSAGLAGKPSDEPASGAIASQPTLSTPTATRPGEVTAGGDVLFGVQQVGFTVDRDIIKIGRELGKFDKIRLRVLENDLFISELRVVYTTGEPDVVAVSANVPANSRTRWLDINGDRFIKEIQLVYRSRPGFKGRARVEVYGEFAENWYGPTSADGGARGEAFKHGANRGWLYLGGQQPKFFSVSLKKGIGYETDVISVARNWGFNRMRLDVKERSITLNKVTVVYGDGTSDTIPVGQKVDGDSSFGPIQVKQKPIREVQVSYRSRLFDKNATGKAHAFVEFWAQ